MPLAPYHLYEELYSFSHLSLIFLQMRYSLLRFLCPLSPCRQDKQPHDFVSPLIKELPITTFSLPQSHLHNQLKCLLFPTCPTHLTATSFPNRFPFKFKDILLSRFILDYTPTVPHPSLFCNLFFFQTLKMTALPSSPRPLSEPHPHLALEKNNLRADAQPTRDAIKGRR